MHKFFQALHAPFLDYCFHNNKINNNIILLLCTEYCDTLLHTGKN